ncbi:MAG TPA: RES family NAD+ phosphorylase [Chthoniobacterales bacterium]|nr:RES family NAD+ phosphorylase [Chthoniobacterales bacterium]
MTLHRLEALDRADPAQAFSGDGGLHAAGRWNSLGTRVVYASSSVALACLETLAHMRAPRRLIERWLFTIEIPDDLVQPLPALPDGWDSEPAGAASRGAGDQWIRDEGGVAVLVPSAIVPLEQNALINPRHPRFRLDWVKTPVRFRYDPRLK